MYELRTLASANQHKFVGTWSNTTTQTAATPKKARAPSGFAWTIKRVVEWAVALVSITFLAPLLLLIALAIRLESRGPALFSQPRFGAGGKPFRMLKFRTMRSDQCDKAGAGQTADNDPRITRLGMLLRRTSIDELPQILNVLTGSMALIGPRAHPCGMQVEGQLCEAIDPRYHQRHLVAPGITGWAQVNGSRGAVKSVQALQTRVSLDLDYIENWSLRRDLAIFARTFQVLVHQDCVKAQA